MTEAAATPAGGRAPAAGRPTPRVNAASVTAAVSIRCTAAVRQSVVAVCGNSSGFVLSILRSFPPLPPLLLPVQAPVQPTTRSRAGQLAPPPADAPTSPPPFPSLRAAASFKGSEKTHKGRELLRLQSSSCPSSRMIRRSRRARACASLASTSAPCCTSRTGRPSLLM